MNQTAPDQSAPQRGGDPKRARRNKILLIGGGVALLVFVGLQFVPVIPKENPPVEADFAENEEVEAILRRACYDCHSHEVRWPWYSRIAPGSIIVSNDVENGRKAFNFSEWPDDEDDRQFAREQAWEQVEEGEMPPWFYPYPFHPEADLTEKDLAILKKWATEKAESEDDEDEDEGSAPTGSSTAAAGSSAPAKDDEGEEAEDPDQD